MRDVIDVNVLRTANGEAVHASDECRVQAIDYLLQCQELSGALLDDLNRIMTLYGGRVSYSGQPGVGDQFFVWLMDMMGSLERVRINEHPDRGFHEFPNADDLKDFDWDDRAYVAVALAAGGDAMLANAVDSDYMQHREAFERAGLQVRELCPGDLKTLKH